MTQSTPQFTVSPPDVPLEGVGVSTESPRDRLIRELSRDVIAHFTSKTHGGEWITKRLRDIQAHVDHFYPQE